jgi:hypothetical protein
LEQYFKAIKATGITDKQMGIWVPFPEPNIPAWNSEGSSPKDFGLMVNNYASTLKQTFPQTHVSILLNSTTFDPKDKDYKSSKPVQTQDFVANIKPKLVDSFGMQGFPWASSKVGKVKEEDFDANKFLSPESAIAAAKILGVKEIWFNSGTFGSKYTQDSKAKLDIPPQTRQAINNQKLKIYSQVQTAGYKVWANEFVEDKSQTEEQTNFSYLQTVQDQEVFKNFATQINAKKIELSLFDNGK